jgi:hypothetical protein
MCKYNIPSGSLMGEQWVCNEIILCKIPKKGSTKQLLAIEIAHQI